MGKTSTNQGRKASAELSEAWAERSARLEALAGSAADARKALSKLREASATMPGGDPFYDELLAPGVAAACRAGAKLEALDLLYFAGAGRLACARALLAAGAPVDRISCDELVDSGVGGGGVSFCPSELRRSGGFEAWSPQWRACVAEMARAGLRLVAARGEDPLIHQAAIRTGAGHLEFLVSIGARVDERDGRGGTALMRAVEMGDEEVARRLLAAGADPWARDKIGGDARAAAARRDFKYPPKSHGESAVAAFDRMVARWEARQMESSAREARSAPKSPRL